MEFTIDSIRYKEKPKKTVSRKTTNLLTIFSIASLFTDFAEATKSEESFNDLIQEYELILHKKSKLYKIL